MHGICLFGIFVVVTLIVLPASPLLAKTLHQEDAQYYTIEPGETVVISSIDAFRGADTVLVTD